MAAMEGVVRPLAETERRLLGWALSHRQRRLRALPRRMLGIGVLIFGSLWVLSVIATMGHKRGPSWYVSGLIWLGIGIPVSLWSYFNVRRSIAKSIRRFESGLRKNAACEIRIQPKAMVEFEEEEDEGACYAFQLGNRRIVFVIGQEFSRSARFPNSDFSLIEISTEDGAVVVGLIRKHGVKIGPVRTIPAQRKAKLKIPEHLQVIDGDLSQIEGLLV